MAINKPLDVCETCREKILQLITERMRIILASADESGDPELRGLEQSHCFHLMELERAIEGKTTVYPMEKEINGPLFPKHVTSVSEVSDRIHSEKT